MIIDGESKIFSTYLPNNQYYDNLLPYIPMIKYEIFDNNFDGLNDMFKFKINIPTDGVRKVSQIKLFVFFTYSLKTNIKGTIKNALCEINIDAPFGASYVKIDGDLSLKQRKPLNSATFSVVKYDNDIFATPQAINLETEREKINKRDVYTMFDYQKIVIPYKNPDIVQIDLTVNVPSFQPIMWEVPVLTKLKFAWVQCLALFIPVYIILRLVQFYIFRNRIFPAVPVSDLPKNKLR